MSTKTSAAIQVLPIGIEGKEVIYSYIDLAISIIKESKLNYMVTPFETVVEGSLEDILSLFKKINEKLHQSGVKTLCINIKLFSGDIGSIDEKLIKYRNGE